MGADTPGWYYFEGQLRYKDGTGWTELYKAIAGPRAAVAAAAKADTPDPSKVKPSPAAKKPRRKTSPVVIAVCAGLIGFSIGGGLLNPDVVQTSIAWASVKAGQVQALISPPAPVVKPVLKPVVKRVVKPVAKPVVKPKP